MIHMKPLNPMKNQCEPARQWGATVVAAGESYGEWKGLNEVVKDKEIMWPPMVVIMNTQLEQDENQKWLGMGNQELLDYFKDYEKAVKAHHSYGDSASILKMRVRTEMRGINPTAAFCFTLVVSDSCTDTWQQNKIWISSINIVKGKSKLKFELVSYQERVVNELKQMSEDNQQLIWYKNRIAKEQMHSKALEESFTLVSQRLRKTEEENRIVRERTQRYHEENKEAMDSQEQFFKDQLKIIQDARNAKEGNFDKLQREERIRVEQSYSVVDPQKRDEKLEAMKEFEEEREKLMKRPEEKQIEMKRRHWKEEIDLEEGFNAELTRLMEKYTPKDKMEGWEVKDQRVEMNI
ncbi:hypothetical protein Lser_V15G23477 [Lactuca serriola]